MLEALSHMRLCVMLCLHPAARQQRFPILTHETDTRHRRRSRWARNLLTMQLRRIWVNYSGYRRREGGGGDTSWGRWYWPAHNCVTWITQHVTSCFCITYKIVFLKSWSSIGLCLVLVSGSGVLLLTFSVKMNFPCGQQRKEDNFIPPATIMF